MLNFEDDINQEQLDAINEPNSVFLVACPGSGKTRTLTYKIAKELELHTQRNKWVVAITYTHSAADEIKERIEDLGVDTKRLWIGTIHAFCMEWIIRPYAGYHEDLKYGYQIINSHDSEEILTEFCRNYNYPSVTYYDCSYHFIPTGIQLSCTANKHVNVGHIIQDYHIRLKENFQIDFEQILFFSYQLVTQHPSISKTLSKLFTHILVDEYQDTKEIQYRIISLILRAGNDHVKAFIVGDPNQAIYTSLGGYAITIAELRSLTDITIVEKMLTRNYRSSSRVIEFFSHYRVFDSPIIAVGDNQHFPSEVYYTQSTELADLAVTIGNYVKYFHSECGISTNEICIVAPWWVHLASMTRTLTTLFPEYKFNGPGLTPFSRDIDNFWYKVAKLILTDPSPQLYVRRSRWANEIIDDLHSCNISTDLSSRHMLKTINLIKKTLIEKDGLNYLRLFFDVLFTSFKINYSLNLMLNEHHNAFFASSMTRIGKITAENASYDGSIETFKKVFSPKTGITVSTIHGVKGTEFDAVIGYGLLDGFVPHFSEPSTDSAKKLIYVLSSRAKKHLCLISELSRIDKYTKKSRPSTLVLKSHKFNYNKGNI
ncbi:ATP-dependent helicase [Shewanella frigidimarina]|uniref:ATP-dependent helicase n=1 Tax=Shewanella frigidimarina TaxID=56812 RepID=UPI00317659D9